MAKVDNSIIKVSGKFGKYVVTNGPKQGRVIRRRPNRKLVNEPEPFRKQASRAAVLNKLASEINRVVRYFHSDLLSSDLYQRLLSYFRNEPLDDRFMLLQILKGFEINTRYRFEKQSKVNVECKREGHQLKIELDVLEHLDPKGKFISYCYECLLVSWTAQEELPWHDRKFTSWVEIGGPKEGFDLKFTFPEGTQHWLLFMHIRGKAANEDTGFMSAQGMRVLEAGTMIDSDLELLAAREKEKKDRPIISTLKEKDTEERVGPRRLQ